MAVAPVALRALAIARKQRGKPYVWGGVGPRGFDCSGLIWYAYRHAGFRWARTNDVGQARRGFKVSRRNLLPGDLVRPHVGHIAMYSGGGRWVEAPRAGKPVRECKMWGFYDGTRIATPGRRVEFPGDILLGDEGENVVKFQQHLADKGWEINPDGEFGIETLHVVQRVQESLHIKPDGVVGQYTWDNLWEMEPEPEEDVVTEPEEDVT